VDLLVTNILAPLNHHYLITPIHFNYIWKRYVNKVALVYLFIFLALYPTLTFDRFFERDVLRKKFVFT